MGPASGGAGASGFRALQDVDIPGLPASKIASGVFGPARLGTGTASGSTILWGDGWRAMALADLPACSTTTAGQVLYRWTGSAIICGGVDGGDITSGTISLARLPITGGGTILPTTLGLTNSRVTYTDASGRQASVTGTTTDCVRVDGTSGACGGAGAAASTVVRTTSTRLTVTIVSPIAFGVSTCAPGGTATIDVSSGTGPASIGMWPDCTIGVTTAATITCTGCTSQGSTGVFPDGVFPLGIATATSGTWDTTITMRGETFRQSPLVPGSGVTFTQSNGFTLVNSSGGGGTWARTVITASGTWTKPATVSRAFVRVWAGGSGGASGAVGEPGGGAGGSGGGFAEGWCEVSGDVTATVGAGGAGGDSTTGGNFAHSAGGAGGDSSFGTCLAALGARAPINRIAASPGYRSGAGLGLFAAHDAARPGASTGGGIGTSNGGTVTTTHTGSQYAMAGVDGAPGFLATRLDQGAHGGGGTNAANGTNGGWAIGGGAGGGGGAAAAGTAGVAGQSQYGGAGGTGGTSGAACTAGTIPGGGGGGGYSPTSSPKVAGCAGARGEIHVYYVQ